MAGEIVSQNLAEAIVKLVAVDALPPLMNNLVMGNLVNRDYDDKLGAAVGDVINIPVPPTLVAQNLAEGGDVTPQNANLGNAQINLSSHVTASFIIPDVTKIMTGTNVVQIYGDAAILSLAEKIETDLLSLASSLTYNAPLGSSAVDISEAMLDSGETALFNAKVPQTAPKYLVMTGDQYSKVRQIARFSEVSKVGGSGGAIIEGDLGKIKSFFCLRSQLVQKVGSTVYNLAFARDAFALVMRRLPIPLPGQGVVAAYATSPNGFIVRVLMSYNPNKLAQQFTVDVLYGYGVLRPTHGVVMQSK